MRMQGLRSHPVPAACRSKQASISGRRNLRSRTTCMAVPAAQDTPVLSPSSSPSVMGHIAPFPAGSVSSSSNNVLNLSPLQRRLKEAGVPDWICYNKPHHAALSTEAEMVEFVSKVAELCWEGILPEDVDALLQWPSLGPWHGSFQKTFLPNLDYLRTLFQDLAIVRDAEEPAGLSPLGRLLRNHPADMSRILNRSPAALLSLDAWACGELGLSRRQLGEAALKSPRILRLCPERGRQVAAYLQTELQLSPSELGLLLCTDPLAFSQSPEALFGADSGSSSSADLAGNPAGLQVPSMPIPSWEPQGTAGTRATSSVEGWALHGAAGERGWNVGAATAMSSPPHAPAATGSAGAVSTMHAVAVPSAGPSPARPHGISTESSRDTFTPSSDSPAFPAAHPRDTTPSLPHTASSVDSVAKRPAEALGARPPPHPRQKEGEEREGRLEGQAPRYRGERVGKAWRHAKKGKRGGVPTRFSKIKLAKERQLRNNSSEQLVPRCNSRDEQ